MKLNSRRFTAESFPEAPEWFLTFLSGINQNLQELQSINTNGITISENLNQEIIETNFKNESVSFPLNLKTKFNTVPKGLHVIYCLNTDDSTMPSDTPWIAWEYANQNLKITSISNLTSAKFYKIRLLVIYS